MLPDTRTRCCPGLAYLREIATCGLKNLLDCAEEMKLKTDALPDELKPYGEAITHISMEVLSKHHLAFLQFISEQSMRDITQPAFPPEQQTEQELLQRSGRDAI